VLFNVLPGRISGAYTDAGVQLPPGQSGGGDLSDTSFINKLPDALAHPFKVGFADGIHVVYLLALAVMLVGLVVVFFLPEIPLAQRSAQAQRAEDAAAAAAPAGEPVAGTEQAPAAPGRS
jgi:hypothetical protein